VFYRLADVRLAVSKGTAADLSALSGISKHAFNVIHNPIRRFAHTPVPQEIEALWGKGDGKRILTVGTFKAVKNHAMLIRAFAKLEDKTAKLMILGTGPLWEETKLIAEAAGVADRVLMPGFHAHPMPFYQSADVFVLSSNHEGFGNVLIEALACGTPVVSTDCPSGPREILQDGVYGTLTPVDEAEGFAKAMQDALCCDHDTKKLQARAEDFAPDAIAQKLITVLGI